MPKQTFFNLPEDKRGHIIDCAVNEFAEHGYNGMSISRLVAQAEIAKGSFYQYFEDKDDLYEYIIHVAIAERKMRIRDRESVKLEALNLTEFIRTLFLNTLAEFEGHPELLKISLDFWRRQGEPVHERLIKKYKPEIDTFYSGFIDIEKSRGEIDPNVDTAVLNAMLAGMSTLLIAHLEKIGYTGIDSQFIGDLVDKIEYILTNGIYSGIEPQ